MSAKLCSKPGCGAIARIGYPCKDWDCPQDVVIASEYRTAADTIARLEEENGRLTEVLGHLLRCEYDGHGLTDCTDNDGVRYQSADLAKQIETAEALLSARALSTGDAG